MLLILMTIQKGKIHEKIDLFNVRSFALDGCLRQSQQFF